MRAAYVTHVAQADVEASLSVECRLTGQQAQGHPLLRTNEQHQRGPGGLLDAQRPWERA